MYTKLKDKNNIILVKLISEEEKKLEMYLFTRYERLTAHENNNIQNIYCKIYFANLNKFYKQKKYLRKILLEQSVIQHQKIKFAFSKCRGIYLPSLLLMHAYET